VSSGIRRLFAIALSGVAALAAALALIVIFGNGLSFIGATVATPLGWSIGVVSLVVIGAAGWQRGVPVDFVPELRTQRARRMAPVPVLRVGRTVAGDGTWRGRGASLALTISIRSIPE
jgi:hypothetical protein